MDNKDFEYLQPGQNNDDRTLYCINLQFCQENERLATKFIKRLDYFSGNTYKFYINWSTRKIRTLFPLKDKIEHCMCIIYEGVCVMKIILVKHEHEDIRHSSEPAHHLTDHVDHEGHIFTWRVLRNIYIYTNANMSVFLNSISIIKVCVSLYSPSQKILIFLTL